MPVVLAIALAGCTSSAAPSTTTKALPAVDLSATPKGWVPVADGDAQVSVPVSLPVVYPGQSLPCDGVSGLGGLLVGAAQRLTIPCRAERRPTMAVLVSLHDSSVILLPVQKKATLVNGLTVHSELGVQGFVDYYAPSVGVEFIARGPLVYRIVDTLTRSPRTVALASGPAPLVPRSWHQVSFQGLSFAAPRSWSVMRTSDNLGMGYPCTVPGVALVPKRGIVLSTDQQLAVYHCPSVSPLPLTPQNGIQVDAGSRAAMQWTQQGVRFSFSNHCLTLHGLTVCPATSPAYSILVLKVTVPGRSKPVYVSIGLAGSGMVARTILYSLRKA